MCFIIVINLNKLCRDIFSLESFAVDQCHIFFFKSSLILFKTCRMYTNTQNQGTSYVSEFSPMGLEYCSVSSAVMCCRIHTARSSCYRVSFSLRRALLEGLKTVCSSGSYWGGLVSTHVCVCWEWLTMEKCNFHVWSGVYCWFVAHYVFS